MARKRKTLRVPIDLAPPFDFGRYAGPTVPVGNLAPLIEAGAPMWLAIEHIDDECDAGEENLALAIRHADDVIITDDLDRMSVAAGAMAATGSRVVAIECRFGGVAAIGDRGVAKGREARRNSMIKTGSRLRPADHRPGRCAGPDGRR